ncbi:MAG: hypothetical protein NC087_10370 [Anaeroplasma bactoclasticum]|nr:hypothetical protein [Anaeroplasma bactoclasticum]
MEENKIEIVEKEEVGSIVLRKAKKAMRLAKKKILFSKICSITIPILVAIFLIGYPIFLHNINSNTAASKSWKNMISSDNVEYTQLMKEESKSIKELNIENKGEFYWIKNALITETFLLKQESRIIIIEEHYNYEGIDCIIYITNKDSILYNRNLDTSSLEKQADIEDGIQVYTAGTNDIFYAKMEKNFNYYFKFKTDSISTIEVILSNLTNS